MSKNVYALIHRVRYEGETLCGVFTSLKKAQEAKFELHKEHPARAGDTEYVIEKLELNAYSYWGFGG